MNCEPDKSMTAEAVMIVTEPIAPITRERGLQQAALTPARMLKAKHESINATLRALNSSDSPRATSGRSGSVTVVMNSP